MSEHDWLILLIGMNVGAALFIFVIISALVRGYVKGYLSAKNGDGS